MHTFNTIIGALWLPNYSCESQNMRHQQVGRGRLD